MFKNLVILALSSVLCFGSGVAATKYCPVVKKYFNCCENCQGGCVTKDCCKSECQVDPK
jgi:hypothetical protein